MEVYQQVPWNRRIIHYVYLSGDCTGAGAEEESKIMSREQWNRIKDEQRGERRGRKGRPGRKGRNKNKSTLCIPCAFQKKLHVLRQKKWLMG